jgi:hypothetical protein
MEMICLIDETDTKKCNFNPMDCPKLKNMCCWNCLTIMDCLTSCHKAKMDIRSSWSLEELGKDWEEYGDEVYINME